MADNNRKRILLIVMFAVSGILIFAGAALAIGESLQASDRYVSEIETPTLTIALLENDKPAEGEDALLTELLGDDSTIKIGKIYKEELAVSNTDQTPQYVRMIVRKYWVDKDGKRVDLLPDLIKLRLGSDGWIVDEAAMKSSSPERMILYYSRPLGGGAVTPPAVTGIGLDKDTALYIQQKDTVSDDGTTITTTYTYNNILFGVEADVDGIQTKHAEEAAKSAWGVDISVADDGTLSLK